MRLSRISQCFVGVCAVSIVNSAWAGCSSFQFCDQNYRDMRTLGRGNAGVAIVNDGTSVFMNPAGLAAAKGVGIRLLDFSIAGNQSFKDSFTELAPMLSGGGGSSSLSDQMAPFLGRPLALQGSFFPHLMMPGVLFGVWDYFDFTFSYSNPVYPNLGVETRNDYGIILGYAKNFYDRVYFGASLRFQRRKELSENYSADSLLSATLATLRNAYKKGDGYGLNLGLQYRQPLSHGQTMSAGLVMEDAGTTRFKNTTRAPAPRKQYQSVNAGIGYGLKSTLIDTTFAFDVRNLLDNSGSYTKKIFTGLEFALPTLDVRAGLYQGYWTLGLTLRMFPLIEIDATSYAEERGAIASQKQNRFYLIGMRMGMDLKGVSATGKRKHRYSLDNL